MASIVGSSWKSADVSGLPPTRSPADTRSVRGLVRFRRRTWVAKYSIPPAGTRAPPGAGVIVPGVVGSRWPWKSLKASSWTLTGSAARAAGAAAAKAATASRTMRGRRMRASYPTRGVPV
jgi:hypothetical protein